MAGAMRKMAVYLGLVEDDQYDDYYYDDEPSAAQSTGSASPQRNVSQRDTLTVSETSRPPVSSAGTDDLSSRRYDRSTAAASTATRPGRDWRTDTTVMESDHPAGSRTRAASPKATERTDPMKITTLHPRTYNDARRIGEEFRSGRPVIMNLTDLDDVDAKRIVDFAAGLVFGLRGSIERVTNKVFMLSPADVNVSAETARAQLRQQSV